MSSLPDIEHRDRGTASRASAAQARLVTPSAILALTDALLLSAAAFLLPPLTNSIGYIVISVATLGIVQAYDFARRRSLATESLQLVGVLSFAAMAQALFSAVLPTGTYTARDGALLWAASLGLLIAGRALYRLAAPAPRRIIVVGAKETAAQTLESLKHERDGRVIGVIGLGDGVEVPGLPYLGDAQALPAVLTNEGPCHLLISVPPQRYGEVYEMLKSPAAARATVEVSLSPLFEGFGVTELGKMGGIPVVRVRTSPFSWHYENVKRAVDIAGALAGILLAAPVMALIALAVKLDTPGPILFRQTRVGRHGRLFQMLKFRSMCVGAEEKLEELRAKNEASGAMFKMRSDPRVTRVGAVIRRLSLDELPQLFNVLAGTMSLVGPRPPLPWEVKEYKPWHMRRLEAVPGLTGLWQIKRGPEPDFEEMVRLDLSYIEGWSLALDAEILVKTIPAVLTTKGAY
jgi:exopolysaccharide biosynthesis polyprenyl glycosylphosphotransferase